MKVYGGAAFVRGMRPQMRVIVAAKSRGEARRFLEASGVWTSLSQIRNNWSETGNDQEIEAATKSPGGTVLIRGIDDYSGQFKALSKRGEGER